MGEWCVNGTKIDKSSKDTTNLASEEEDENGGLCDFEEECETMGKDNGLDGNKKDVCIGRGIQGNNL